MSSTPPAGAGSSAPESARSRMNPGAIVLLILGTLVALCGLGLAVAGGALTAANAGQRADGYLSTPTERFSTDSYALTSPGLQVLSDPGSAARLPFDAGTFRFRATAARSGSNIFVGVGPRADVERYLDGVHRTEVTSVRFSPFRVQYRDLPGSAAPARPADQQFWAKSASGAGTQEIVTPLQPGEWTFVVMNTDASQAVSADLQAGFHSDLLGPLSTGLLIGGLVLLLIGVPLTIGGAIGLGRHVEPTPGPRGPYGYPSTGHGEGVTGARSDVVPGAAYGPADRAHQAGPPESEPPYPARLAGTLDPRLSRWMWLVKWFLAIPHVIVLFFLWFAFAITTIVAWFAILFTGRYPRAIFNFNVGVLRWTWRVDFYAFTVAGTDQYPPFTLAHADYPADFEVDYPERLSRGLVLVKAWLLAIPQLLVVAAFTGGGWTWGVRTDASSTDYYRTSSPSLLGLLVLVAVVILLFTGIYRRALFDFIMGINRWVYRVLVYVALMRDEYPPFRLDQGPGDAAAYATQPRIQAPPERPETGHTPRPEGPYPGSGEGP